MPKAVATATIRPAASAGSPRLSTSQAGNSPASARKIRAKQKKAIESGAAARSAPIDTSRLCCCGPPVRGMAMMAMIRPKASRPASTANMIRQSAPSAKAAATIPESAMPTGTKVPHSDRANAWCRGSAAPTISEGQATTTRR